PSDDTARCVGQGQGDEDGIDATHEGRQLIETEAFVDGAADGRRGAVADQHTRAEGLGAGGNRLADMSKAEQADGARAKLGPKRARLSGPEIPVTLTETLVGARDRNMPQQ